MMKPITTREIDAISRIVTTNIFELSHLDGEIQIYHDLSRVGSMMIYSYGIRCKSFDGKMKKIDMNDVDIVIDDMFSEWMIREARRSAFEIIDTSHHITRGS